VTPSDRRFVWGGHYETDTLVWRSRWVTCDAVIECREALALPSTSRSLVLLRRIVAVDGDAHVDVVLDPRPDFGREHCELHRVGPGTWAAEAGSVRLRWRAGDDRFAISDDVLTGSLTVPAGSHHDLVLELSCEELPREAPDPDTAWSQTEALWHQDRPDLADSLAEKEVRHSYAVLRGLTSGDDGMVAAATMSLPERAEAGRNYDYRYAWVRDQCLAGHAGAVVGAERLLQPALRFVSARLLEDGPHLKPAYTVDGGSVPDEKELDLPGYPGGSDKVGNWVNGQFQLDAPGEALLLFAAARQVGQADETVHQAARVAARVVASRWNEPDAGIWELDDQHWTHSKLMCVAGLRAYARAAPGPDTADWPGLADQILADTSRRNVHPSGRWQRSRTDERVDAALVIPALRGALPADAPRSRATLRAVIDELEDDGYVYRFRQGPGPLDDYEGAFLLCGFQLAMARQQVGDVVAAARTFERNRSAVGPPGLFTEEFDVLQRQQRGNLPQAFVHALLIEAATDLARAEGRLDGHSSGHSVLNGEGQIPVDHPETARTSRKELT
jgi:GH15 family glucan-1,4-alpha-glucosidase